MPNRITYFTTKLQAFHNDCNFCAALDGEEIFLIEGKKAIELRRLNRGYPNNAKILVCVFALVNKLMLPIR